MWSSDIASIECKQLYLSYNESSGTGIDMLTSFLLRKECKNFLKARFKDWPVIMATEIDVIQPAISLTVAEEKRLQFKEQDSVG